MGMFEVDPNTVGLYDELKPEPTKSFWQNASDALAKPQTQAGLADIGMALSAPDSFGARLGAVAGSNARGKIVAQAIQNAQGGKGAQGQPNQPLSNVKSVKVVNAADGGTTTQIDFHPEIPGIQNKAGQTIDPKTGQPISQLAGPINSALVDAGQTAADFSTAAMPANRSQIPGARMSQQAPLTFEAAAPGSEQPAAMSVSEAQRLADLMRQGYDPFALALGRR